MYSPQHRAQWQRAFSAMEDKSFFVMLDKLRLPGLEDARGARVLGFSEYNQLEATDADNGPVLTLLSAFLQ